METVAKLVDDGKVRNPYPFDDIQVQAKFPKFGPYIVFLWHPSAFASDVCKMKGFYNSVSSGFCKF